MKYKVAREIVDTVKSFDEIEELVVFKKPYTKTLEFTMKDGSRLVMNLRDYSYVSLSNHGFLFIRDEPYDIMPVHLNRVEDLVVL